MTDHESLSLVFKLYCFDNRRTVFQFLQELRRYDLAVVPRKANEEMIEAMTKADREQGQLFTDLMRSIYAASIKAGEVK